MMTSGSISLDLFIWDDDRMLTAFFDGFIVMHLCLLAASLLVLSSAIKLLLSLDVECSSCFLECGYFKR